MATGRQQRMKEQDLEPRKKLPEGHFAFALSTVGLKLDLSSEGHLLFFPSLGSMKRGTRQTGFLRF